MNQGENELNYEEEILALKKSKQEAREQFYALVELNSDAVAVVQEGWYRLVNSAFCRIFGYTRQDIKKGLPFSKMKTSNEKDLKKGECHKWLLQDIAGNNLPCEISTSEISFDDAPAILMIIRNTSEREQAEREKKEMANQLIHSQKMEAVGRLAGGLAHDFNNILTAILGYGEWILNELGSANPLHEDIEAIIEAAEQAGVLTGQLLAFSRKTVIEEKVFELNHLITQQEKLLRHLIGKNVDLLTVFSSTPAKIKGDPDQIRQVIMNLVVNSSDAMAENGEIAIKMRTISKSDSSDCARVCLTVEDNGAGMSESTRNRIFEPFFSTKKAKGTGLGLSVVYGIIQQHNGEIRVKSNLGEGTIFEIYLPLVDEKLPVGEQEPSNWKNYYGNNQKILVVEDNARLRKLSARILEENGYLVFEAANYEEAISVANREGNDFHLLFSDVVLPEKTGLELYNTMLLDNPSLNVLLTSGYTEQNCHWEIIRQKGLRFLQKPYSIVKLLQNISETISQSITQ